MSRIDYFSIKPDFITRLRELTREQEHFGLDSRLRALVELRVSQINGCAYCMSLHRREAQVLGEEPGRLESLSQWKESPLFSERETAALAWAESMTLLPTTHAGDADHEGLFPHFTDTEIVELSLSISLANFWNRMAAGFRKQPNPDP